MTSDPRIRAVLWTTGSLLSFSAMAVAGRELGDDMETIQILAVRSVVGLIITGSVLLATGWRGVLIRRREAGFLVLRNSAHLVATYCWFLGLSLLPIAEVFAIEFTMPVWTAVLSVLFLGERLGRLRVAAIVLGFVGTLIILRPDTEAMNPDAFIVLLAAFLFAISFVVTRRVIVGMPTFVFLFYMSLMQAPPSLALALLVWSPVSATSAAWLVVTSCGGLAAHYCLARALKLADATLVAPMDFLRLPLIATVGAVVYGEGLGISVALGAALVCCGNWLNLRSGRDGRDAPPSARASGPLPGPDRRKI